MGDNEFYVSKSNDGRTFVVMQPGEQVYVDVWDITTTGFEIARKIAELLNDHYIEPPAVTSS